MRRLLLLVGFFVMVSFFMWDRVGISQAETGMMTVCPVSGAGCDHVGPQGIQAAIDASGKGGVVLVKQGNYQMTSQIVFMGKSDIVLKGEGDGTVIVGNSSDDIILVRNDAKGVEIRDLSITKGAHSGIKVAHSSEVKIVNVNVFGNGNEGVYAINSAKVEIADSRLHDNVHDGVGAEGAAVIVVVDSQIFKNGELGVYAIGSNNYATIKRNEIFDNGEHGIYVGGSVQDVAILGNKIYGNKAYGIALVGSTQANVINNLIYRNNGVGVDVLENARAMLENNVVAYNVQIGMRSFVNADVWATNNIAYKNGVAGIDASEGAKYGKLEYNLSFGHGDRNFRNIENWSQTNNVSVDPLFKDAEADEYELKAVSPAIDAGDPTVLDPDGTRSDMGAYGGPEACVLFPEGVCELNPTTNVTPGATATPTPGDLAGDLDDDGDVDVMDLNILMSNFGKSN